MNMRREEGNKTEKLITTIISMKKSPYWSKVLWWLMNFGEAYLFIYRITFVTIEEGEGAIECELMKVVV